MPRVILFVLGIKLVTDSSRVHSMEVKQSLSRDTRMDNDTFARPLKVQKTKQKVDYRKLKKKILHRKRNNRMKKHPT